MGRRKKVTGRTVFSAHSHVLSETARRKLAILLAVPADFTQALDGPGGTFSDLGRWLAAYPGLVETVDNEPLPVHYTEAADNLIAACGRFYGALDDLTQRMRDELATEGPLTDDHVAYDPIDIFDPELARLMDLCVRIKKKYAGVTVRGNKRKRALRIVVAEIRRIFCSNYRGSMALGVRRGAIRHRSPYEVNELEFVETALRDGAIRYAGDIRRYFDDDKNGTGTLP